MIIDTVQVRNCPDITILNTLFGQGQGGQIGQSDKGGQGGQSGQSGQGQVRLSEILKWQ